MYAAAVLAGSELFKISKVLTWEPLNSLMTGSETTDPCTAEAVPGNETFPVPALSLNCVFCNLRYTAFVTLSTKSSKPAYGGLAGPGSWSACSSFSSTRLWRLAGCCSDSCKIVVFLFTLADTRRDILKRKITQYQYTCELETYSKLFHCLYYYMRNYCNLIGLEQ